MAKRKESPEDEFRSLVDRMHNCGDLKVLNDFITELRDDCKYRRYDPETIASPQALTSVSGEELAYDNILTVIANSLEN